MSSPEEEEEDIWRLLRIFLSSSVDEVGRVEEEDEIFFWISGSVSSPSLRFEEEEVFGVVGGVGAMVFRGRRRRKF